MDKNKEIEKILKVMHSGIYLTHSDCAIALVNAGIGDKKQAVKEFAEKLMHISEISVNKKGEVAYHITGIKIDNLVTELYGADKKE